MYISVLWICLIVCNVLFILFKIVICSIFVCSSKILMFIKINLNFSEWFCKVYGDIVLFYLYVCII